MQRLDDLCRTERYFTATLLPALLLQNPKLDVPQFIRWLADIPDLRSRSVTDTPPCSLETSPNPQHVEVITELNLKRDLRHYRPDLLKLVSADPEAIRAQAQGTHKQSVPDVVLRVDDLLVVIEAKFFGSGVSRSKLNQQLIEQREEIALMRAALGGAVTRTVHLYLGPRPMQGLECDGCFVWDDVAGYARSKLGGEHYVTQRLDAAVKRFAKRNTTGSSAGGGLHNYAEQLGFEETLKLCRSRGDEVLVGFNGGEDKLVSRTSHQLKIRKYKVDFVETLRGTKVDRNWITGSRIVALFEMLAAAGGAAGGQPGPTSRGIGSRNTTRNYAQQVGYDRMIELCKQKGDKIVIGFDGGESAIRSRSPQQLEVRHYKVDDAEGGQGSKSKRNWISGARMLQLLRGR